MIGKQAMSLTEMEAVSVASPFMQAKVSVCRVLPFPGVYFATGQSPALSAKPTSFSLKTQERVCAC